MFDENNALLRAACAAGPRRRPETDRQSLNLFL